MNGRRHSIEHWRVAAMLLLTLAAAVGVFYILTEPGRVAAWYTVTAAVVGMGLLVRGTGP